VIKLKPLLSEKCWSGYKQVGMKKKGQKQVPNCVPEAKLPTQGFSNKDQMIMYEDEIDEDLKKWFGRNKGKGWIDCNTCKRNPKTGRRIKCKACAGKDRKKYPDCRPTPSKCSDPGRGKKWGKKSEAVIDEINIEEKKDACYHKVKGRYKVWPSAYASGALVQCRKKGAKNWGKTKKTK